MSFISYKKIGFDDFNFQASPKWLHPFKTAHRIVPRKIDKFITSKQLEIEKY